ncbi:MULTISPECIES: hypothetical protein [Pacificibacter]|uniref:hypothetical protein n=1 Tax=Pacificibacter TaxID=1042323 RepID=UPI001C08C205|nr:MULTISPECIES: hypothetical protein [Pacificibacter]MBU2937445.1 hypothetical protein [Pacificibacter marinus]MDO6615624.1 hypothetical protein [Pacificibacter sp. 1_MG-2023]
MTDFDRTTIVVGAGASFDFGFPTGDGLISTISKFAGAISEDRTHGHIVTHDKFLEVVRKRGRNLFGSDEHNVLRVVRCSARIKRGLWLAASIDNYLNEQQDEDIEIIGKFLISASILYHERVAFEAEKRTDWPGRRNLLQLALTNDSIGFSDLRQTWLVPFFRALRGQGSSNDFEERLKKLTLIIFNYDRAVEFFLFRAIQTYENVDAAEAKRLLDLIQIIHPYGTIGDLPELSDEEKGIAFGENEPVTFIKHFKAEMTIQTFGEANAGGQRDEAQAAIKASQNLVFLGFGFLPQNVGYLGRATDLTVGPNKFRKVFATTYGMSSYRQGVVRGTLVKFAKSDPRLSARENQVVTVQGTGKDIIDEYGGEWFR